MMHREPFFPKNSGKTRVDDRRGVSGIFFIDRNGLRWCDTPREYGPPNPFLHDGERDISGGITKAGDVNLRRALCQAATVMMHRGRAIWLRTWAAKLARRRGAKRALVALARRIAVILHRMSKDDTDFHFEIPVLLAG